MSRPSRDDLGYLEAAARLAVRGHGGAEPNPLVGCLIVAEDGPPVGWGYHRRCGGPHAERIALDRAGLRARGATAYVTLEPCNHAGRTPPCADALIEAGIKRVVFSVADPNPVALGGAARLREAGVIVDHVRCDAAWDVSRPHVHRVRTGLPWVIAKWAQTLDGRVTTPPGQSRWISCEASRRIVHRERGRVDAILSGIGTVLADDPLLTARDVRRRRRARRVVLDSSLRTPPDSRLVRTARECPTTIICAETSIDSRGAARETLERAGCDVLPIGEDDGGVNLRDALACLVDRYDAANVLVEAGPTLLGRLFRKQLVNQAWIFVAPRVLGEVEGMPANAPADGIALSLRLVRRCGTDAMLDCLVQGESPNAPGVIGGSRLDG